MILYWISIRFMVILTEFLLDNWIRFEGEVEKYG